MSWRDKYKIHPAAEKFELLSEEELKALSDDIKANGLKEPVTIFKDADGVIWLVDGRNRLDAIELIPENERPQIEWLEGEEAEDQSLEKYILSKNLYRRHLNMTKQQKVEKIAEVLGIDLSADRLSANLSVKDEKGQLQGTVKNLQRATLIEEAAKVGASEATVKTTIAKARGSFKPRPITKGGTTVERRQLSTISPAEPTKPESSPEAKAEAETNIHHYCQEHVAFLRNLRAEIPQKRKEAHDERQNRRWQPEAVNRFKQSKLLDWIESELEKVPDCSQQQNQRQRSN